MAAEMGSRSTKAEAEDAQRTGTLGANPVLIKLI
jgi:hypothetical protein